MKMQTYRVLFTAVRPTAAGTRIRIRKWYNVRALDAFHAQDKIAEQIDDYHQLRERNFYFPDLPKVEAFPVNSSALVGRWA